MNDAIVTGDGTSYLQVPVSMLEEPVEPLLDWARSVLATAGYQVQREPVGIRRRSWSTVAELTTDRGRVWVKANARGFAHEAALLELLAERAPHHVLHPIAIEARAGWLITPDGGEVLEAAGPASETDWIELISGYADLQREVAPSADRLREIGLLDMTPPTLTGWFRRVLNRMDIEPNVTRLFDESQRQHLLDLIPDTQRWAAELTSSSLPMTVEHNDLHPDNVFVDGAGGRLRIFDWGDAVITHPFICLGRVLRIVGEPGDDGAPPLPVNATTLRDAYLRRWLPTTGTDIPGRWHREAELAEALSSVVMGASWLRLPLGFTAEWGEWFAEILIGYVECATRLRSRPGTAPAGY